MKLPLSIEANVSSTLVYYHTHCKVLLQCGEKSKDFWILQIIFLFILTLYYWPSKIIYLSKHLRLISLQIQKGQQSYLLGSMGPWFKSWQRRKYFLLSFEVAISWLLCILLYSQGIVIKCPSKHIGIDVKSYSVGLSKIISATFVACGPRLGTTWLISTQFYLLWIFDQKTWLFKSGLLAIHFIACCFWVVVSSFKTSAQRAGIGH